MIFAYEIIVGVALADGCTRQENEVVLKTFSGDPDYDRRGHHRKRKKRECLDLTLINDVTLQKCVTRKEIFSPIEGSDAKRSSSIREADSP